MQLNFLQFVSSYFVKNDSLCKRKNMVIVRTFPNYPSNPKGSNFALFCKYQLLCHVGMNFWKLILASSWFQIGNMKWTIYQHILKLHVTLMTFKSHQLMRERSGCFFQTSIQKTHKWSQLILMLLCNIGKKIGMITQMNKLEACHVGLKTKKTVMSLKEMIHTNK